MNRADTPSEIREAIRSGARSAVEVCREALARIEAADASLHAFNTVTAEQALARAAEIDGDPQRFRDAPLAGVPVALKDNICTRGVPHDRLVAHSRALRAAVRRHGRRRGCTPPAPSSSARPTATSSRWGRPPRTRRSVRRAIRGRSTGFRAGRAAVRPSRSPPGWPRSHSDRTPADRSGSRRPCAACRPEADVRPRVALRAAGVRLVARSDRPADAARRAMPRSPSASSPAPIRPTPRRRASPSPTTRPR